MLHVGGVFGGFLGVFYQTKGKKGRCEREGGEGGSKGGFWGFLGVFGGFWGVFWGSFFIFAPAKPRTPPLRRHFSLFLWHILLL